MPEPIPDEPKMAEVTCSFCNGSGKDQFGILSWDSTCCVCGGRGVVQVAEPYTRCPHCDGTGAIKRLTCTVCGGKGYVSIPSDKTSTCPECHGSGDDWSDSAMPCLKCHGRGFISEF
jgi:DnaJ-class molecular chaperone